MAIKDLIDSCQPYSVLDGKVLDPCSCFTYYEILDPVVRRSCEQGLLFDHTRNECRVKGLVICNPRDPFDRCDTSSKYFPRIKEFCEVHNQTSDIPVNIERTRPQTFTSVSQSTATNTMDTQTSDFLHFRADIVPILMAMLAGAVLMLMLLLLLRMFRRIVKRRSRPSRSANRSDQTSNGNVIAIYDDIEDGGEIRYNSRQRSDSAESTVTMEITSSEMRRNHSQDNYYCSPGELIRDKGAVGKTVPEETLNYITAVPESNHGSVSNYQLQTCNARSEYFIADDPISFDNAQTESTYSYARHFKD